MEKFVVQRVPIVAKEEMLRYAQAAMLVDLVQSRMITNLDVEWEVLALLHLYNPLIQKLATRASLNFQTSWEDAKAVIQGLFYDLVIEYNPRFSSNQESNKRGFNHVYFSHYVAKKLPLRTRWYFTKHSKNVGSTKALPSLEEPEGSVNIHTTDMLRFVEQRLGEERADLLFGYFFLSLTQSQLAKLFGTHQVAVSIKIREALLLLREELVRQ